jgi:hypothetical protein
MHGAICNQIIVVVPAVCSMRCFELMRILDEVEVNLFLDEENRSGNKEKMKSYLDSHFSLFCSLFLFLFSVTIQK